MISKFTRFGKITALALLGTFSVVDAQAVHLFKVSQDFLDTALAKGIDLRYVRFAIQVSPDFSHLSSNVSSSSYFDKNAWKTYNLESTITIPELKVEVAENDSVNVYYQLVSDNFFILDGCHKMSVAEFNSSPVLSFNPLENAKEVTLLSPTSREGNPFSAEVNFIGNSTSKLFYYARDLRTKEIYNADTNSYTVYADTVPVFVGNNVETSYEVRPDEQPYFPYEGKVSAESDTLTVDYRKASEIHFRIKDVEGNMVNIRDISGSNPYLTTKMSQSEFLFDWIGRAYTYHFQGSDYNIEENYVRLYAMPGTYYGGYWSYANKPDCPSGLEGIVTIDDQQVQDWVIDYGQFITLRCQSNLGLPLTPEMLFKRKVSEPSVNKLLENVSFDHRTTTSDAYTRVLKDENGNTITRIWPAMGFETVAFSGNVGTYHYQFDPVVLEMGKEYTYSLPDLGVVRYTYPRALNDLGADIYCDSLEVFHSYRRKDIDKFPADYLNVTNSEYVYHETGEANLSMKIILTDGTEYNQEQKVNVAVGDTADVKFELKNAAVFNLPRYFRNEARSFDVAFGQDYSKKIQPMVVAKSDSLTQNFYLFNEDKADYCITGSGVAPQLGTLTAAGQLQFVALDTCNAKTLTLLKERGSVKADNITWSDESGRKFDVEFFNSQVNRDYSLFAFPGRVDFDYYKRTSLDNYATYHYAIDLSENLSVEIPWDVQVTFAKGEQVLHLGYRDPEGNRPGDIKLYYLSSPLVDHNTALPISLGHRGNYAYLLAGIYCAEDLEGNKYYFEVPDGVRKFHVDLDNLPTGIEGIENATSVPAAYYDLSGRRIDTPRKGLNIIRMQNGTVRKVMIK